MSHQTSHGQYTEISGTVDLFSTNTDTVIFYKSQHEYYVA